MLVEFPVLLNASVQQLVLVLNTTLLIAILTVTELIDNNWLPEMRRHLRDFYPLLAVLIVLMGLAVVKKIGTSG